MLGRQRDLRPPRGRVALARHREIKAHLESCHACRALVADASRALETPADEEDGEDSDFTLAPGTLLDRYVILETVGAGAMGIVYAAYDPDLGRKVALKLLRVSTDQHEQDVRHRLLREAQALAQLSHPNVVTVLDVGRLDQQIFLAMEFVDGETLTCWLEKPRSTSEVILAFVQAGEGLAAAHGVGLVHRDFKPDNVLVGRDGRVRVTDFGLARATAEPILGTDAISPSPPTLRATLTRAGVLIGTPAYMAPEQMRGQPADWRSDQYSFSVALYEALFVSRPRKRAGDETSFEVEPPSDSVRRVPRWLRRILARGLAVAPEERWASMRALLDALQAGPLVKKRLALVAFALAAAMLVALFLRPWSPGPCAGAEKAWGDAWNGEVKARASAAFRRSGRPNADTVFAGIDAALEAYRAKWLRAHTEICLATRVRGEQSETLLDRRMRCLADRKRDIDALVRLFMKADAGVVDNAPGALVQLATIESCTNARGLEDVEVAPIPADPAERARIDEQTRTVAALGALHKTGQLERLRDGLAATSTEAIGYAPLRARLLWLKAACEINAGRLESAAILLHRAASLSIRSHEDGTAADSWIELILIEGQRGDLRQAQIWADYAKNAIARIGGDEHREAILLSHIEWVKSGRTGRPSPAWNTAPLLPSAATQIEPVEVGKVDSADPFAGTWVGTVTDGRTGFPPYSIFTMVITTGPLGRLHVEWQSPAHGTGSYDGTWSGKSFSGGNDRVVGRNCHRTCTWLVRSAGVMSRCDDSGLGTERDLTRRARGAFATDGGADRRPGDWATRRSAW